MRRGRLIGGIVIVFSLVAMSAPYALAAGGSAVDQGYPCATAPGGTSSGQGSAAGQSCGASNVAAATHTKQASQPQQVAAAAPATHSGTLPFTGAQLGVFVLIGVLLIGGGLVLRASGRTRTDT